MSRAAVAYEANAVDPGQTLRVVCPFCGGGSSGERSMAITRNADSGLVLYICFRGHCGASGVIGNPGVVRTTQHAEKPRPFRPWDNSPLVPIVSQDSWCREQLTAWHLNLRDCADWSYDWRDDRLCMPIFGPHYDIRGYVRRARPGTVPKVLTGRLVDNKPMVHFDLPVKDHKGGGVVLVEDIPSARKISTQGVKAIALLGCTPSDDAMEEVVRYARNEASLVVVALDRDAHGQSVNLVRQLSLRVPRAAALLIDKDFKNMTIEEVSGWLQSVR